MSTSTEQLIHSKLQQGLRSLHVEVRNESSMHNVPPGSETHFRVLVVSPEFTGQSRVARHRAIHRLLEAELAGGVHALAIDAFTESEWQARGELGGTSPKCRGGDAGNS